jgi:hypothetical protein
MKLNKNQSYTDNLNKALRRPSKGFTIMDIMAERVFIVVIVFIVFVVPIYRMRCRGIGKRYHRTDDLREVTCL